MHLLIELHGRPGWVAALTIAVQAVLYQPATPGKKALERFQTEVAATRSPKMSMLSPGTCATATCSQAGYRCEPTSQS